GMALLRAFLGEAVLAGREDAELERRVRADLGTLLGIRAEPLFTAIARWEKAMPQYPVAHLERIARIERQIAALPGLALAGNAYTGVGIPDCIHSGEHAAQQLLGNVG